MSLRFVALPVAEIDSVRAGRPDAYGLPAERRLSDGDGNPCRCCLTDIPAGRPMLVLAWRPFPSLQPYAETGPIFLCADCARRPDDPAPPPIVASRPRASLRGYTPDHRIVEGTGQVVEVERLEATCARVLRDVRVGYLHLRSAVNGCYQLRVERG